MLNDHVIVVSERQKHAKSRPSVRVVFRDNPAAVGLDDIAGNGEAHAHAFSLGAEERLEHPVHRRNGNA